MNRIIAYLLGFLFIAALLAAWISLNAGPTQQADFILFGQCACVGAIAGVLYCLRAVYVNTGLARWDSNWSVWYYLRPITSAISGFASCIFLRAGLLALSSKPDVESTPYGYFAVAFIAGYNVDFFMKKIEQVAQEMWGIEKSRAAQEKKETNTESQGSETKTQEESK